jgi:hypothetical protein
MLCSTFLFGIIAAKFNDDRSWMNKEEKTTQLTEQQKQEEKDNKMLEDGNHVSKRKDWLEAYLSHFGFAPQSDCTGQTDSCPTGFRASCYENEKGECERKWTPNSEKCSELTGPSESWYGTSNEVQKTMVDETYCNEFFCTKNEDNKTGPFCRESNTKELNARKNIGRYNEASKQRLIDSGKADGLFDEVEEKLL